MKDEVWIHGKLRESEDILKMTDETLKTMFKKRNGKIRHGVKDRVPFTSEEYTNAIASALFTGRTQAFREVLELELEEFNEADRSTTYGIQGSQ